NISNLLTRAKKYKTRSEFSKNDHAGFVAAHRRGIIDQICRHMDVKLKKYTNKDLLKLARKYTRRSEFRTYEPSAYMISKRRGLFEKCCAHMKSKDSDKTIPVKTIANIAKKYKHRVDFLNNDHAAYEVARRRGFL